MSEILQQKKIALNVVETLQRHGHEAFFAGGCVRDELMGRTPKDYDVATSAKPGEVEQLFPKTIPIGKAFGVIAVVDRKETVEVATFRKEAGTIDGRHPETIHFCAAKEDALRRDFTINGMFYDPLSETLYDYVGGQAHLEQKRIVSIGNPEERYQEDHLRMLRAIRFAHTLGFSIEQETDAAIQRMAQLIRRISAERIESELTRTLTESINPGDALLHLHQSDLLKHILPEIIPMVGQEQPPQFHPEGDVFEHTVLMLNLMQKNREPAPAYTHRELAYAVLLHDVGKPSTARIGPGTDGKPRIRFDGHAEKSAQMADDILMRLKFPNKERKHIVEAIRGHMRFMNVQDMRTAKLRRLIGAETFGLELELHRLDCLGSHQMLDNYEFLQNQITEMENEPALPEPWVNGHDLIAMGIREGRQMGRILREAYNLQIEGGVAGRDELLERIRNQYGS